MAKTLVIMESGHKCQIVQGFLGPNYIVKPSVGHVREMPLPKQMTKEQKARFGDFAVDMNSGNFETLYQVEPSKRKLVADLKALLKKCDELVLMSDDDNEGHAISWHLLELLDPQVPAYRAVTNEITRSGVADAMKNKKYIDRQARTPKEFYGGAESALTRGAWDRIYGFSTSPYVWRAVKGGTSSGRVQTPGTRLVVEREERRLAFKSVSYYTIVGTFGGTRAVLTEVNGKKVAGGAQLDEEGNLAPGYVLITDDNVDKVLAFLRGKSYEVEDVRSRPYRRSSPPPFNTSTALQSIGAKTRMSSKQLTAIFQSMYQNGDITYIRTMSVVAAPEAITAARKTLEATFGKDYVSPKVRIFKDKNEGNSGHECIRPVVDNKKLLLQKSFADPKEQKVFDLIRMRMLASQAIDCTGTTWTAIFASQDRKARFAASETEILEPGWTKVYATDEEESA